MRDGVRVVLLKNCNKHLGPCIRNYSKKKKKKYLLCIDSGDRKRLFQFILLNNGFTTRATVDSAHETLPPSHTRYNILRERVGVRVCTYNVYYKLLRRVLARACKMDINI